MLEIRRGSAARSYENTFFREFALNLEAMFKKYSIDGLLIANSECEISPNLQIDSLLITENAICLIDLKNFGGEIIIPQGDNDFSEGQWVTHEGVRVKGGSHINPYKQLFQQKKAFTWVFHNSEIKKNVNSTNNRLNPSHVKKIVCFQKPIQLKGEIPGRDEIDFFITDSERYLETIKDILDVDDREINLSKKSFDLFKNIYKAETFKPIEKYHTPEIVYSSIAELKTGELYPDQKAALQEITKFIKSDTDKIFILQGTSLSGKSHLIPFIEDIAFNHRIAQVEFFASSSRVASNLLSECDLKFNSLYSYIYGGGTRESSENIDQEGEPSNIKLEVVPLKKNDDEDRALFIVDESQLVSDNYHQSIDLRFGSGRLLEDFILFSDLLRTNRKIIFIGDSFQLSLGKKEESALNPSYFDEKYKLPTKAFQLVDKEDASPIIKQALIPVKGIRSSTYNQLLFNIKDKFETIERNEIKPYVLEKINNNSFHLLSYSNYDALKINQWIKKAIICNSDKIAENDLVIINNNFKIEDKNNPFSEPKKIFNGQFGTVIGVATITSETVTPKGKSPITLNFREINIVFNEAGHEATVLSLENYRLSDKGEISEDEIIALKIIINREVKKELEKNPFDNSEQYQNIINSDKYKKLSNKVTTLENKYNSGEKVKTKLEEKKRQIRKVLKESQIKFRKQCEGNLLKDTSSKFYKYKNLAHLRFGWALTVHKSMSYKWDEVLFNVDQGENRGKMNEAYFKWVYTGITRAKTNICLINYKPITPFCKFNIKPPITQKSDGKKLFYIGDPTIELSEFDNDVSKKYNFPDTEVSSSLLQLFQFLTNKIEPEKLRVGLINHQNYQEMYEIVGTGDEKATISIYFNKKGQFKMPSLMKSEPKEFGTKVIELLRSNNELRDFGFIKDSWRELAYDMLNTCLINEDFNINYIIQSPYKDTIKVTNKHHYLVVDMFYDGGGFFTTIASSSYTDISIWNEFIKIINRLKV